jgi:cellulose synthase/poly-beta-1,6-N-acetylglucosamine synthase-like glycosyltransferase
MIVLEGVVLLAVLMGLCLAARQYTLSWRVATGAGDECSEKKTGYPENNRDWPTVSILIPVHNEEAVLGGCLAAMTALDYPTDKLTIVVINDRSTDRSGAIAEAFAVRDARIKVLHREATAPPGKAAAIADGTEFTNSEILVLFDADYLPPPELLKELVSPFEDEHVGATMGRVVPSNADANVLTRLLDLERRAGYGVDQTGRELWHLLPQFGGTVGGIRRSALEAVGGWRAGHLAEDTDLTFRLVLGGWRVAYLNHARCHEEVPQESASRFRQVRRWAYGHNQCLFEHLGSVMRSPRLSFAQKLDGALILNFYFFPACALLGTVVAIPLLAFRADDTSTCVLWDILEPLLAFAVLAPYTQVMVAARADGQRHVARALPLLFISASLSLCASVAGLALLLRNSLSGLTLEWDKTRRYRTA